MRSWWGWGTADQAVSDAECVRLAGQLPGLPDTPLPVPDPADLDLPKPRTQPPAPLAPLCSTSPADRASHAYGKAYRDVVRALHRELPNPPDVVAYPHDERDIASLIDWATDAGIAVVPYGGGSSVVGGVEYRGEQPWLSLDLSTMDQVLDVDTTSTAIRVQAGTLGPALEDQLRPHGLTLRHFPQSFEFSSVGGWLATRAGGHYATLHTHIDDFVESLRVLTPSGVSESLRVPASGAGPSPDRFFLGSEGILGVITEAWLRVRDRPVHKTSRSVSFPSFHDGLAAMRTIVQSGLYPANCRLLDQGEAALSGASTDGTSVLVLGFESAYFPVASQLDVAVDIAREHGGTPAEPHRADGSGTDDSAVESWRSAFLRMPYLRDGLARMSAIVETFETACTWARAEELYTSVRDDVGSAVQRVTGSPGMINCRVTHAYPDGPAPYFTVIAPGQRGSEVTMWDEIKAAASESLVRNHATITHHHAVGRDHVPSYEQQRPDPFAAALRHAKAALDPAGVMNPGVLGI